MKSFLFLSCIFFILYDASAQQLEVYYKAYVRQTYTTDEKLKWFSNDELGRAQIKANEEPPIETYKLIILDKETSFTFQDKINNDQNQEIFNIRYAPAGFGTIYRNLKDSIVIKDQGEIYGKTYISLDSIKTRLKWKIHNDTKTILGYNARKATLEDSLSTTTVWFVPKIPIPTGPAEFWGLPGLIIEVEKKSKERNYIVFYLVESINNIRNPKIVKPNKGIMISEFDINRIWEEGRKRMEGFFESQIDIE